MSFERSASRRFRLRTTLAVMGLVGSSLAMSTLPARAVVDPKDPTPTENYVPKAGYVYDAPRPAGRLTPATGALFGTHSDEVSTKKVPAPTPKNPTKTITVPAESKDQAITKLEADIGRKMDIDNHYTQNFDDFLKLKEAGQPVQMEVQEQLDLQENRIPLVGWACGSSVDITAGKLDAAIDAAAEAFKAYPRDFFMRYCWEMDGSRPSKRLLAGKPDQFIAAWRYIYNRFRDVDHVTNVVWVFTGNANGYKINDSFTGNKPPAPQYYPGDDYVDWVSSDGYNWHGASGRAGQDRYRDFVEIYDQFMLWARSDDPATGHVGSSKPIMIAEYGSQENNDGGAAKALWLQKAHAAVEPRTAATPADCKYCGMYSDIQAMVYYDVAGKSADSEGGWTVRTSQKAFDAYKQAALDPWFNHLDTLTWGPYNGGGTDPGTDPGTEPGQNPGGNPPGNPDGTAGNGNPPVVKTPTGKNGYWMLGSDGKVYAFGQAANLGAPALPAGKTAVDLEATPDGNGYWIVDNAGNVYAYGTAVFLGGVPAGALAPGENATSISATPSGQGYWVFTNKGRAVRFGDATFFGDMSRTTLAAPVLDSIPTSTGQGYYMVAADGGIFSFGDAKFFGSMGGKKLNAPVQSLVPDSDGAGYWLVASDGGIFAFDAPFKGSMGDKKLSKPVTGMVPYGSGYMMVGEDGGIFNFSDKPFDGSLGANPPSKPIVSVSALG
ncbi:MAG TPA: glycosyl hydrolase [Acidimicrobiia bacterium]|nr:glycosyl hydrolase [Acidimicrobiia bacterium]